MKIPVTYTEAKQLYPQEVAAAVRALRASSSVNQKAPLSKIEWEYIISVKVEGFTLADIHSGEVQRRMAERAKLSWETRIQQQLDASKALLHAFVGHWVHNSEQLLKLPPEWVKHTREEFRKMREEQEAYEALPATEKEARKRDHSAMVKRRPV